MRIEYSRKGGIAFFPGFQAPKVIDSHQLSPAELDLLKHMIMACHFFDLPPSIGHPTAGAGDYQHEVLTIEDDNRRHTVRILIPARDRQIDNLMKFIRSLIARRKQAISDTYHDQ